MDFPFVVGSTQLRSKFPAYDLNQPDWLRVKSIFYMKACVLYYDAFCELIRQERRHQRE